MEWPEYEAVESPVHCAEASTVNKKCEAYYLRQELEDGTSSTEREEFWKSQEWRFDPNSEEVRPMKLRTGK